MTPPEALARRHAAAFDGVMRPWSVAEFQDLLSHPRVHLIDLGHVFAVFRVVADEAEILTLATDPTHRRQGLARAILTDLQTQAMTLGARHVFLEVADTNVAARALYASCGYSETGRRTQYYLSPTGDRVDALVLTRTL